VITKEERDRLDALLEECIKRGIIPHSEGVLLSIALLEASCKPKRKKIVSPKMGT
jgi:hypothetical protein